MSVSDPAQVTTVTVGTTAGPLIPQNKDRTSWMIAHTHSSATVFWGFTPDVAASGSDIGHPLFPRTYAWAHLAEGDDPRLQVYGISDTASTVVVIVQYRLPLAPGIEHPEFDTRRIEDLLERILAKLDRPAFPPLMMLLFAFILLKNGKEERDEFEEEPMEVLF